MSDVKPYQPIDCNFYDRLEAWSVKREVVNIKLFDSDEIVTGLIKDLYIKEKVEYLILDIGTEVRLDKIKSVNGIPLENGCGLNG